MKSMCLRRGKSLLLVVSLFLLLVVISFPIHLNGAMAAQQEGISPEIFEGAKKEGKLLWYITSTLEVAVKLNNQFREKYPFIQADVYRGDSGPLATKVIAETQAKRYFADVVLAPGGAFLAMKEKGVFTKYVPPQSKFYPEGFKDPEGYWTDVYLTVNVIAYNTKLVSSQEAPRTWNDLLDPKWKGRIALDSISGEWLGYMLKVMGREKGVDYMKKLSEQNIRFLAGRPGLDQMLAAGDISLAVSYREDVERSKANGAPVEWVGIEPNSSSIHPIGITAHAPHPNAAKLFVDFALSQEGQQEWARLYRVPSRPDVKPLGRLGEALNILPPDPAVMMDYDNNMKLYRQILMKK